MTTNTTTSDFSRLDHNLDDRLADDSDHSPDENGVAIVGASCRVPGARTVAELWDVLREGRDTVTDIPRDRLDVDRWYSAEPGKPHSITSVSGGFLDGIDRFDAGFFDVAPREAEQMDPQQRMLLQVAWEAVEDAGHTAERLAGSNTGVYLTTFGTDYWDLLRSSGRHGIHAVMGSASGSMAAGRVNYHLDLRGPVMSVESACATPLLSAHLAVRALRSGEIDGAIIGAANLLLSPDLYFALSEADMLSPTGRCRFGDRAANGYVRSEGAVVLVLKRLSDAVRDGDRVYASIIGSATRSDGRSGGTLTSPGVAGQEDLLRAAYADAGVSPAAVDFVEAHGSGTPVGDPVELNALATVLGENRDPRRRCLVGSVKTNIGHLEGVAGYAGLLKAALALHHGEVPATLQVTDPLDLFATPAHPLRLATGNTSLDTSGRVAPAGVSAFGLSGANAHLVLASVAGETASTAVPPARRPAYALPLSARSTGALRDLAEATAGLLDGVNAPALAHVCHTAGVRRTHHERRLAVVGGGRQEIIAGLSAIASGVADASVLGDGSATTGPPEVVFVFPGQGSQWPGMGRELLRTDRTFAAALRECDRAVAAEAGWSVVDKLVSGAELSTMDEVQPVLWAVQVALAATWRAWGIEPRMVVGHSMGEVAAAVVAGALTVAEGAAVICRRSGLLARRRTPGAMWAVQLGEEAAAAAIGEHSDLVSVGVVNSAHATVLSGDPEVLTGIVAGLRERGVFCSRVQVDYASHAPQVAQLCPSIEESLTDLRPRTTSVPMYSTVLDRTVDGAELGGRYWADNLRLPVRFSSAVRSVLDHERRVLFLEISPHPVLRSAVEDDIEAAGRRIDSGAGTVGSLSRAQPELESMLTTLAHAYTLGCEVDWARLTEGGRYVPLPGYPWQSERFWVDDAVADPTRLVDALPVRHDRRPAPVAVPAGTGDRLIGRVVHLESPEDCLADLLRRTSELLGVDASTADVSMSLTEVGMNSLFAAKLVYELRSELGIAISIRELLGAASLRRLAELICRRLPGPDHHGERVAGG